MNARHGRVDVLHTIETVLFDLDGTLTAPVIDFADLRGKLGLPLGGGSMVAALALLPAPERAAKEAILLEAECGYARQARANEGARELVNWLRTRGVKTAVVTRNHPDPVEITFRALGMRFDVVLHRNSGFAAKPRPDCVREALRRLGRAAAGTLMVGDYVDDIAAGRAAGTRTCFVTNGSGKEHGGADLVVRHPGELLAQFQAALE